MPKPRTDESNGPPKKNRNRKVKFFELSERNDNGLDSFYWVQKKRDGFFLRMTEEECEPCGPHATIEGALNDGARQYGGEYVEIDTNVRLEELFDIMGSQAFEPLLHNASQLILNGAEIRVQSLSDFVSWHAVTARAPRSPRG
jgi:hypothetical protein